MRKKSRLLGVLSFFKRALDKFNSNTSCYLNKETTIGRLDIKIFTRPGELHLNSLGFFFCRKEAMPMKYGVAVTIIQTGYIEVEADCEPEAKAKAEEAVSEDRILYHETEVKECKIEGYF